MSTSVLMYHYVRPRDPRWAGIVPLEPAEFDAQVDAACVAGEVVAPSKLSEAAGTRPRFVLTFDDGTSDHFAAAMKLKARGLSGLFAVMSGPSTLGYIPNFHLVHALVSSVGEAALWDRMVRRFGEDSVGTLEAAKATYPREKAEGRARLKFALNYALAPDVVRPFLLEQFAASLGSTSEFIRQWYLTDEQIVEMRRAGMEIAIHAHKHVPFSEPADEFVRTELDPCREWIQDLLGEAPVHYVAAFGGKNAGAAQVTGAGDLMRARGVRHFHLTKTGVNQTPSYFITRHDCADAPPRKAWPAEIQAVL